MSRALDVRTRAIVVVLGMAAPLAGLGVVRGSTRALVALAVVAGAARGLFTLVGATLVSDYWGTRRYAAISGVYNAPILAASALAPWLGAVIADRTGSLPVLFLILAGVCLAAAALTASIERPGRLAPSPARAASPYPGG